MHILDDAYLADLLVEALTLVLVTGAEESWLWN